MTGVDTSIGATEIVSPVQVAKRLRGDAVRAILSDAASVLGLAGKVLAQHWPVLLALALAGEIARARLVIFAGEVAYELAEVGWLVLALAPLSVMIVMVLMLRRARRSLPALATAVPERGTLIANVAPVLVPFLLYYAAAGMLNEDWERYKQFLLTLILVNFMEEDRVAEFTLSAGVVGIALLAVIAGMRWILRRWSFARRHPVVGLPGAYLEVLWLTAGAVALIEAVLRPGLGWAQRRRAWLATVDWMHGDFQGAGPLADPARAVVGWWLQVWSLIGSTLVVPIAALMAGAVVYGIRTQPPQHPAPHRPASAARAFAATLVAVPRNAVRSRVGPSLSGLRLMVRVGLVPMLVFCLAYAAADALTTGWLWVLERTIVGPQDWTLVWIPLNRVFVMVNDAVLLVLLMSLVGGALGRVASKLPPADGVASSVREQPDVARQLRPKDDPDGHRLGIGREQEVRGTFEG